jgi:protein-S-isoprenylcysteine O-methyltransferase Ste14
MSTDADLPRYRIPPPLPPVVALVLIVVLDLVAPVEFLPQAVSLAVGIPLLVLGAGLWGWGVRTLFARGEHPAPHKVTDRLITGGAFGVSRNPIYAGGTTALLGLALLLDTATGVAVAVVLGLVAHTLVPPEEVYLEAKFGDEYRAYRSRVRRWI